MMVLSFLLLLKVLFISKYIEFAYPFLLVIFYLFLNTYNEILAHSETKFLI